MIRLVKLALDRPYTFLVMAILILVFGPLVALRTSVDIFPDIKIPVISVVWNYSGMSPNDMSGRILYSYERSLSSSVNDIEHIESQSILGYGVVKIYFQPNVDIRTATAQVTSISQSVLKQMPAGITPPVILNYNASTVPILQLALSSQLMSEQKIYDFGQNFIRPQLASVPGSTVPSPYGGKTRQIQIDLDPQAMLAKHVSPADIQSTLSNQNLIIPVGTIKLNQYEYNVKLNSSPEDFDEINNLPIKTINGATIFIHDVAHVRDGYPPQSNIVRVNGSRAVLMSILKSGQASTLDVIEGVKKLLPKISETLPKELQLNTVGDQSLFVKAAVTGVMHEGIIAALLTSLMILIFLGSWRSTLIISATIPLAILSSIIALSIIGESLNIMTLGGLALAIGILVDDATVTIENINWHLEQGKAVKDAILDGAKQIVTPAFVSLLSICIVFIPMFFLTGVSRYLFVPMAEAVVFAMLASFILSRTLIPTLANYLLRPHASHGHAEEYFAFLADDKIKNVKIKLNIFVRFQRGFDGIFESLREGYSNKLKSALSHRGLFIFVFMTFIFLSFLLVPFLGQDFFPSVDSGQIKIHVRTQIGTRVEATVAEFDRIERTIRTAIPSSQLKSIVDNIGMPNSNINQAYNNTGTIGAQDGDILVTLNHVHSKTNEYIKKLREILPRTYVDTSFSFLPADIVTQILNFGSPSPIDIQIMGPNQAENLAYVKKLTSRLKIIPGIADLRLQQANDSPELRVDVDRSRAKILGITEQDVTSSLVTTLAGTAQIAPALWLNPKNGVSYPIVAQTPQYRMDSFSSLENIPIPSSLGGDFQVLGALATIKRGSTPAVISHYAIQPSLDIFATAQDRDLGGLAADIQKVINDTRAELPKGSSIELRGQVKTMNIAFSQLLFGLLGAILLIYLLIVMNFQSWSDPFVVVTALPSALAGIVWMLFVTSTSLSVPALTGAIMCMGVATANSVLVITFAREKLTELKDPLIAAMEAGFYRFRPVLMTALAMILGMLPMALGLGEGGEQNAPLGRAVIGGLMFATVGTLFLVPVIFSLVHQNKQGSRNDHVDSGVSVNV